MEHVSEQDAAVLDPQPTAREIEAAGQVPFDFGRVLDVPPVPLAPAEYAATPDPDAEPAREPFGSWLIAQTGRKGWIADLAKAAKGDPRFPKRGDADDVRKRLKELGAEGDAYEALDDAELEYLAL